jgi:hypothetical protein
MKGYCNEGALDKDFLIENLQNLEANKAGITPIFGSWEWREYYKHVMCTVAIVDKAIWITLRIPMVKKSEKLVRCIPTPELKRGLLEIDGYGITPVLFKETNNDKYHIMTQTSLEMCNLLGNTRSCGVRDTRFRVTDDMSLITEISHNRFLIISANEKVIKFMEKCPNGVNEHIVKTDSAFSIPNNCSYISPSISIEVRESDYLLSEEINAVHFEKISITRIGNYTKHSTSLRIEGVANRTSMRVYDQNKKLIEDKLEEIDTRHTSLWESYSTGRWFVLGGIALVTLALITAKLVMCNKLKRIGNTNNYELTEMRKEISHEIERINCRWEAQQNNQTSPPERNSTNLVGGGLMFSSSLARSQFVHS